MTRSMRISRMSNDDLLAEAQELFAKWMTDSLPLAYEERLHKLLNELARRGGGEARRRAQKRLWGEPTLFDPEV